MWPFRKRKKLKKFALKAEDIRELLYWDGPEGCFATDRIMVDGCHVGYMYREQPEEGFADSGWRFFEGGETKSYLRNLSHTGVYTLNEVCNYDPAIMPLLKAPYGTAFVRCRDGSFQQEPLMIPTDA